MKNIIGAESAGDRAGRERFRKILFGVDTHARTSHLSAGDVEASSLYLKPLLKYGAAQRSHACEDDQ